MSRKVRLTFTSVALFLALMTTACGLSQSGKDSTVRQPTTLKIGCYREISEAFLWDLSRFSQKYGITPECVEFAAYAESMQAVARGDVDLGYSGIPQIATAADGNLSVKAVAGYGLGGQNIVLRKGVTASAWSDLQGKRICAPLPSGAGIMLRIALLENDVDLSKVQLIDSGFVGQANLQALQAGNCDGLVMWSPIVDTAVVDGYAHYATPLLDLSTATSIGAANGILFAGARLLKDRALLVDFLKAYTESLEFMRSHPDEWRSVAIQLTGVRSDVVAEALKHQGLNYNLDLAAARAAAKYGPQFGYAKSDVSSSVASFVDASFLSAATGKTAGELTSRPTFP